MEIDDCKNLYVNFCTKIDTIEKTNPLIKEYLNKIKSETFSNEINNLINVTASEGEENEKQENDLDDLATKFSKIARYSVRYSDSPMHELINKWMFRLEDITKLATLFGIAPTQNFVGLHFELNQQLRTIGLISSENIRQFTESNEEGKTPTEEERITALHNYIKEKINERKKLEKNERAEEKTKAPLLVQTIKKIQKLTVKSFHTIYDWSPLILNPVSSTIGFATCFVVINIPDSPDKTDKKSISPEKMTKFLQEKCSMILKDSKDVLNNKKNKNPLYPLYKITIKVLGGITPGASNYKFHSFFKGAHLAAKFGTWINNHLRTVEE
jgi:hypothetical protein